MTPHSDDDERYPTGAALVWALGAVVLTVGMVIGAVLHRALT
jgi:hypothetical protein